MLQGRVLHRNPTRHLRQVLVVLLDLQDGLLRLGRRNPEIDADRRGQHARSLEHHVPTVAVEMDLPQILRRDLVRMACRREFQQAGF